MKYRCKVCGYVYDEDVEKVPFSSLPDSWKCPLCGADKSLFELEGQPQPVKQPVKVEKKLKKSASVDDDVKMNSAELSVLLSNLARGCEKQYKTREMELFMKLSQYFQDKTQPIDNAKVEAIAAALLKESGELFPQARQAATEVKDRGALRAITWGEKVTTILNSLVNRYLKEGNNLVKGKHIYVCTICGFIYIGDKVPDLCPVCKVQSFKFEEVI